jgi:hypothetical protein
VDELAALLPKMRASSPIVRYYVMTDLYWCEECDTRLTSIQIVNDNSVIVTGRAWCVKHRRLAKAVNMPTVASDVIRAQDSFVPNTRPRSSARHPSAPRSAVRNSAGRSKSGSASSSGTLVVLIGVGAVLLGLIVILLVGGDGKGDQSLLARTAPSKKKKPIRHTQQSKEAPSRKDESKPPPPPPEKPSPGSPPTAVVTAPQNNANLGSRLQENLLTVEEIEEQPFQ